MISKESDINCCDINCCDIDSCCREKIKELHNINLIVHFIKTFNELNSFYLKLFSKKYLSFHEIIGRLKGDKYKNIKIKENRNLKFLNNKKNDLITIEINDINNDLTELLDEIRKLRNHIVHESYTYNINTKNITFLSDFLESYFINNIETESNPLSINEEQTFVLETKSFIEEIRLEEDKTNEWKHNNELLLKRSKYLKEFFLVDNFIELFSLIIDDLIKISKNSF